MSVTDFELARLDALTEQLETWQAKHREALTAQASADMAAGPLNDAASRWLLHHGTWHLPDNLPYARLKSVDSDGRLRFSVTGGERTFAIKDLVGP